MYFTPSSQPGWKQEHVIIVFSYLYVHKCKNIFIKMLKDVGIEVLKSIETRSKCSMHADKGRG